MGSILCKLGFSSSPRAFSTKPSTISSSAPAFTSTLGPSLSTKEESDMRASKSPRLPKPHDDSAYTEITPFETGRMITPSATLVEDAKGASTATSWRFLLRHPKSDTSFWFDMGISHDLKSYPPAIQKVHEHFRPLAAPTSIEADTLSVSIPPSSIKHVIISHAHWDHVHPLPPSFSSASMIVGPGSTSHCAPGFPSSPSSKFDSKVWDSAVRSFPLRELPPTTTENSTGREAFWRPLGPFPFAHDFFGDGSFWLVDAPGHMSGNLMALTRVRVNNPEPKSSPSSPTPMSPMSQSAASPASPASPTPPSSAPLSPPASPPATSTFKYVLLGGDCAHCNLFTYWPDAPFGKMPKHLFPSGSLHECGETARKTIHWIAEAKRIEGEGLLVWYAHGEFLEGVWDL